MAARAWDPALERSLPRGWRRWRGARRAARPAGEARLLDAVERRTLERIVVPGRPPLMCVVRELVDDALQGPVFERWAQRRRRGRLRWPGGALDGEGAASGLAGDRLLAGRAPDRCGAGAVAAPGPARAPRGVRERGARGRGAPRRGTTARPEAQRHGHAASARARATHRGRHSTG